MTLIKKKDAANYFDARRRGQPFLVPPTHKPDATASSRVDQCGTNADDVTVIEVPGPKSPVVESPVPVISSEQNSPEEFGHDRKRSARA